ncbi:hypothetical protein [Halobacillus trueperi]|nr:hypothetical protein [Halobacillus trueperi]
MNTETIKDIIQLVRILPEGADKLDPQELVEGIKDGKFDRN